MNLYDIVAPLTVEEAKATSQRLDAKCWKGKHKEGTKVKGGVRVNNCVPNESVAEDAWHGEGNTVAGQAPGQWTSEHDQWTKEDAQIGPDSTSPVGGHVDEARLHVGDPVVVTAPNEFEGKTGEIAEFSPSGKFVIVNLYNHGRHSMHLSDVEYNQYADEQDDLDENFGNNPVTSAITRRILMQRHDLLKQYSPELVGAAVDNVADYVGDVDEIGSSDVSGWVNEVERMLKENPPEAFSEEATDPQREKAGKIINRCFGKIYDYGDSGLEYLDRNAPVWSDLFSDDQYDGDIDTIIARAPIDLLVASAQELMDVVSDLPYELEEGWSDAVVAQRTGRPRTPYSVYIKGKKWKDFENDDHAEAVANKLRAKFQADGRDPSVITIAPTDYDKGVAENQWDTGDDVQVTSDDQSETYRYKGWKFIETANDYDSGEAWLVDPDGNKEWFGYQTDDQRGIRKYYNGQDQLAFSLSAHNEGQSTEKWLKAQASNWKDTWHAQPTAPQIHEQGVAEVATDYSKRRQREKDVDAGKPVAKQRQSKMTDYQKRRAQQKKEMELGEEWSKKYKSSINCSNPKGFSQKAHCAGKKKNESVAETTNYWTKLQNERSTRLNTLVNELKESVKDIK